MSRTIPTEWAVREVRRSIPTVTCDGEPIQCCCLGSALCFFHWHYALNLDAELRAIVPGWPERKTA